MSLKHDIEKHPWAFSKELLEAVEDYKSGKRNSKRRLRKIVNRDRLSDHFYKETIERYSDLYQKNKKDNKHQIYLFGFEFKEWLPVLMFVVHIFAIGIVLSSVPKPNFWVQAAAAFLMLSWFVNHHFDTQRIQEKDQRINELETEIKRLKSNIKGDEQIIEFLDKEFKKANEQSQKE
jgi:hypothetical protein